MVAVTLKVACLAPGLGGSPGPETGVGVGGELCAFDVTGARQGHVFVESDEDAGLTTSTLVHLSSAGVLTRNWTLPVGWSLGSCIPLPGELVMGVAGWPCDPLVGGTWVAPADLMHVEINVVAASGVGHSVLINGVEGGPILVDAAPVVIEHNAPQGSVLVGSGGPVTVTGDPSTHVLISYTRKV